MTKVIGISSWTEKYDDRIYHEINMNFAIQIEKAGGIPMFLPVVNDVEMIEMYLKILDGMVLIGGEDVVPFSYGEEPTEHLQNINFERDQAETVIFRKAMEMGIPVLGICRGMQLANVAMGGTLYQDIDSQVTDSLVHVSRERKEFQVSYHSIHIEKDSILNAIYGDSLVVNSFHHQSLKDMGENLRVTAVAADGIVEAVENIEGTPFLGLQFHPEFPEHNSEFPSIFEYYVQEMVTVREKAR